ncbi:MAG TPA: chemotaxis protein CheB, partial [Mizugakiibacter sp.]
AGEPAPDAFAGPPFTETPAAEAPAVQVPAVEAPAAPPLDLAEIEALFEELPGMSEAQPAQRAAADTPDELAAQLDALFADAPTASTQAAPEMTLPPEPHAREGIAELELDAPIDLPKPGLAAEASAPAAAGLDDLAAALAPTEDAAAPAPEPPAAVAAPAAPNWDLVDLDDAAPTPPPPPAPRPQPREFGVEKVSAAELIAPGPAVDDAEPVKFGLEKISTAEYLAPDAAPASAALPSVKVEKVSAAEYLAPEGGDAATTPVTLGMSLELVPMEEAIAPQAMEVAAEAGATEMRLDRTVVGVRRVVALGASIGGPEAVREFVGALPKDTPATVVLAQHLDAAFVDAMVAQLAKASPLPVRVAAPGTVVGHGEVLVVPSDQRLRLDRGGRVRLEALPAGCPYAPSIDHTFGDLAEVFGADLLAVVFSGMASDAVAGVLEVTARGGKVWAQDPDSCVVSSMVDGACEAGVVAFTGTPRALAARLLAELGKEP